MVSVNALLVPVVVRDAQGRVVGNLKKEDFELFDKNKPQAIAALSIQQRPGAGMQEDAKVASSNAAPLEQSAASIGKDNAGLCIRPCWIWLE